MGRSVGQLIYACFVRSSCVFANLGSLHQQPAPVSRTLAESPPHARGQSARAFAYTAPSFVPIRRSVNVATTDSTTVRSGHCCAAIGDTTGGGRGTADCCRVDYSGRIYGSHFFFKVFVCVSGFNTVTDAIINQIAKYVIISRRHEICGKPLFDHFPPHTVRIEGGGVGL